MKNPELKPYSNLKACSNCGTTPTYTSHSVAHCDNIKCTGRNMVDRWNDRPIEGALQSEVDRRQRALDDIVFLAGATEGGRGIMRKIIDIAMLKEAK